MSHHGSPPSAPSPLQAVQLEHLQAEVARLKARSFPSFAGVDPRAHGLAKRTAPPADQRTGSLIASHKPGRS